MFLIFVCSFIAATTYYSSAHFGAGSGLIWLDNLKCSGTEFSLLQCSHIGIGVHNCGHSEDASVKCSGTKTGSFHILFYSMFTILKRKLC